MSRHSGISLFLIELIIMLAVFVAAAAIDTLMLVKANNISQSSSDLNRAIECASSAAECFKSSGNGEAIGMHNIDGVWTQYYDSKWVESDKEGAVFTVTMKSESRNAEIEVSNSTDCIYNLSVKAADYYEK